VTSFSGQHGGRGKGKVEIQTVAGLKVESGRTWPGAKGCRQFSYAYRADGRLTGCALSHSVKA
jgi:hypothetical protein